MTERANYSDTPSDPDHAPAENPDKARGEGPKKPLLDELLDHADGHTDRREAPRASIDAVAGPRTRVGSLVAWSSGEAPKVNFPGNEQGPLAARSTIVLDPTIIAEAIASERGVLLTFEDGRPDAPIITGLLQNFPDTQDPESAPQVWDDQPNEDPSSPLAEVEARIDGRRVEIEAADEIVLRCGKASIVLRRNGRVVIRGTYVETRSGGVNRVKGGSVQIN